MNARDTMIQIQESKAHKETIHNKNFRPKFVSAITALSLSISASSVMASHPTWGISQGNNLTISNSGSVTTITAKSNNSATGQIEVTSKQGHNSILNSLSIQSQTSITNNGTNALILINTNSSTIPTIHNEGTLTSQSSSPVINIQGHNITIQNLINKGIMKNSGHANSVIKQTQTSTIINFTNEGTIEAGANAIYLENAPQTFTNSGLIKAKYAVVWINDKAPNGINLLKNTGTLISENSAINTFLSNGSNGNASNINTLINEGLIQGKENGIELTTISSIENKGSIIGQDGAGILIKKRNGNNQQNQITGQIKVEGLIQGKTAGIINEGKLGSAEGQDVIVVGSNGKIEGGIVNGRNGSNDGTITGNIVNNSNNNLRITNNNQASFKGNITNNGTGTLEINNQGKTGDNTVIKNSNSSGSIKIKDWKVDSNGSGPKTVKFEGQNITLEKLTISEATTDITKVANAFSADNGANKADIFANTQVKASGNGAVTITGDLLRGLVANIDGSKTAAAALNRTLIATATARATFLDTVMGNALNTLSFLH
ncbi:MAG: hypothetical protein MSA68_03390, partial [Helicobacter sp.]|nr:hypothetical protein [Helicobacter sp.]